MNKNQGTQPIEAAGTYLYQLDDARKGNLWGGHLQTQNQNEQHHLKKAMKIMLAADDLLSILKQAKTCLEYFEKNSPAWHTTDDAVMLAIKAAIAKAES